MGIGFPWEWTGPDLRPQDRRGGAGPAFDGQVEAGDDRQGPGPGDGLANLGAGTWGPLRAALPSLGPGTARRSRVLLGRLDPRLCSSAAPGTGWSSAAMEALGPVEARSPLD